MSETKVRALMRLWRRRARLFEDDTFARCAHELSLTIRRPQKRKTLAYELRGAA